MLRKNQASSGLIPADEKIKVFLCTWNMGDAAPDYDGPTHSWIPKGGDLYVISVQVFTSLFFFFTAPRSHSISHDKA